MAMMISRVARVNSSHPYLENDPSSLLVSHHLRISPWLRFRSNSRSDPPVNPVGHLLMQMHRFITIRPSKEHEKTAEGRRFLDYSPHTGAGPVICAAGKDRVGDASHSRMGCPILRVLPANFTVLLVPVERDAPLSSNQGRHWLFALSLCLLDKLVQFLDSEEQPLPLLLENLDRVF